MSLDLGTLVGHLQLDTTAFNAALGQSHQALSQLTGSSGAASGAVGHLQQATAGAAGALGNTGAATHQATTATQQLGSAVTGATQATQQQDQATSRAGNSLSSFAKKAIAVVGVGKAIKSTMDAGMDFESTLNTLGAVSGATAQQMKQVSDTARQLGNDIEIPGASAATAAAAMTELTKGGLSVAQSMEAAKGTLQLAAAAQIDGAEAAEIQAKAINTFGLAGKDAAHVGDVLANTANAASGEIDDFAQALAQGGLVAHSLGISIDDTSTALGLFANQGLLGSDAGTSLKTMLVSLQSPSKQQAAALKALGVQAFDASGNFVGMRTVTEQLSAAQADMTQQQFAAAASTAFGTDAVRAAIAVAAGGPEAWDAMSAAVGKSGGAAELAGAQMKGLKGAFSVVQNAVQDAQLALMDKLSPALDGAVRQFADMIPGIADSLVPALATAGQAIVEVASSALPLLASGAQAIAPLFTAAASGVSAITPVLNVVVGIVGGAAKIFGDLPAPVHAAVLAMLAMRMVRGPLSSVGSTASTVGTKVALMGRQISFLRFQGMGAGMATMAVGLRAVGTAATTAGRGLMAAFGGPIGLAIIGITTAISIFSGRNQEAAEKIEEHKQKISELADTMDKATGAITESSKDLIRQDFGNVEKAYSDVGLSAGEAANAIIKMSDDGGKAAEAFKQKIVDKLDFSDIGKRLSASGVQYVDEWHRITGLAQTDILEMVARGGSDLDQLKAKLAEGNVAPQQMADGINRLRGDVENVSSTYSSFTGKQDQMNVSLGKSADLVKTTRQSWAELANVDFGALNRGLELAAKSGGSLETALYSVGLKGQTAEIIKQMGDAAHVGANGMHYLTEEAANANGAVAGAGDAAAGAQGQIEDTDEAVGGLQGAFQDAKPPADGLKASLDLMKSATDGVTTASDLMAAAVLRAAGIDLTAEQAQRENAAAMRGVTEGILDKTRAAEDDKAATADRIQAEKDLQSALDGGRKKGEKDAEYEKRKADLSDKVAAAKRKEQDAHLKNAAAQTADREGLEKAAQSALDMANNVGLAALATGTAEDASKAAAAEFGRQREAMIKAAEASGKTRAEAEKYVDQLNLTPEVVSTQFKAVIDEAEKNGSHLVRIYDEGAKTWKATFLTDAEIAQTSAKETVQLYDRATGTWSATIAADNAPAMDAINETNRADVNDKSFSIIAYAQQAIGGLKTISEWKIGDKTFHIYERYVPSSSGNRQFQTSSGAGLEANGHIVQAANGLVRNAMIAPGGSNILWAEPETGWEAYIPGAPSKRNRSEQLLSVVARRFGGVFLKNVRAMADGGVPSGSSLAGIAAPSYSGREGVTRSALGDLVGWIRDLNDAAKDAAKTRNEEAASYYNVRVQQNQNVAAAKADRAEKLAEAAANIKAAKTFDERARALKEHDKVNRETFATLAKVTAERNKEVSAAKREYEATVRAQNAATARAAEANRDAARTTQARSLLVSLARQTDQVTAQFASASDRLKGLQSDWSSMRTSLRNSIAGFDNGILGHSEQRTTAADIIRGLQFNNQKVAGFSADLSKARSLGLSADLLQQIAGAGVDGGATTAHALANATRAQIAQINQLQKVVANSADRGAQAVSNATYAKAISDQTAAVRSLATEIRGLQGLASDIGKAVSDNFKGISNQGLALIVRKGEKELSRRG